MRKLRFLLSCSPVVLFAVALQTCRKSLGQFALPLNAAVGAQYDVGPDSKHIAATYSGDSTQPNAGHVIFLENFTDELHRKLSLGTR